MMEKTFAFRVLEKAEELIRFREVHKISDDTYLARQHSDSRTFNGYMIKKNSNGIWVCTCQGYKRRHICSHSIAVLMIESRGKAVEGMFSIG